MASLFDMFLLRAAMRAAMESSDDDDDPDSTTAVTRTDRFVFHEKHSELVSVSSDRKTAKRQISMLSCDRGIAFSEQQLRDDEVFEIRIDEIMPFSMWERSLDIGVTALDPMFIDLPKTMTDIMSGAGTWMLSGDTVVKNRVIIKRRYCRDLKSLSAGDRLGVSRTKNGYLHFFINGEHQGVAAKNVPQGVHAVVDIYGKCTKVSIFYPGGNSSNRSYPSSTGPSLTTQSDPELTRYKKHRQWLQECKSKGFQRWVFSQVMSATSDDERRELFLFTSAFGHCLDQDTSTCDGCKKKVPIKSHRYLCMECQNLDLCDNCFSSNREPRDHQLDHKLAEMKWLCKGKDCGGFITGARFQCMVCKDFDLCYGCQKTKNWPIGHNENHTMTKSSTLTVQRGRPQSQQSPRAGQQSQSGATAFSTSNSNYCPKGEHNFSPGKCVICTNCGGCTGYGKNCVMSNKRSSSTPKELCGCGYGDAGCTKCGVCKGCVDKIKASPVTSRPSVTPRPMTAATQKCEFREMCERYVKSLKIADEYFDDTPAFNKCFCEDCHKARGDRECYSRGNPAKIYALPIGWSRFAIKVGPHANVLKIFENWHVAFHGTEAKYLQLIFNNGAQLLMAGDVAYGGSELHEGEGHYNANWKPRGFDTKKIFVSPSIKYSGCAVYAKKQSFIDPVASKKVAAQVALQVLIRPGSYQVGKTTVERAQPFDANFSDEELEWSTKERGAVIVTGLLVKITKVNTEAEQSKQRF
ncbi:neuralized-like protein 4 [Dendronephthya gigantea]|uniref:neuralized-like protein 4 n=1 Tax=Dendronephthya gigantea TaxID=151771 RepID=UPI00106BF3FC|nr:neuralized-like protein 4 [Dendronephthya gigantea]